MTQQEQQAIEKASKECADSCCAPADEVIELNRSSINEYLLFAFMQGAKALDEIRNPDGDLVKRICEILDMWERTDIDGIRSNEFNQVATEIAKLAPFQKVNPAIEMIADERKRQIEAECER